MLSNPMFSLLMNTMVFILSQKFSGDGKGSEVAAARWPAVLDGAAAARVEETTLFLIFFIALSLLLPPLYTFPT